jgi:ATP-dependent helicase/DNAse subunit B
VSISISHTGKELYKNCPYSYYLHYILKLREDSQSSALFFGKAVDEGLNHLLVNFGDVTGALKEFNRFWNSILSLGLDSIRFSKADLDYTLIDKKDQKLHKDNVKMLTYLSLKEKGRMMIEQYNIQILPLIKKVVSVQNRVNIKNDAGDKLNGVVDFIAEWYDGRIIVFDNKTTSVTYKEDSVRTSEQLATYEEAMIEQYGKIDACGFIVVNKAIRKKKEPLVKIDVIIDTIPDELHEKTFKEYDDVITGIKSEKFDKNWNGCKTKFGLCQYYEYCRSGDTKGLKQG